MPGLQEEISYFQAVNNLHIFERICTMKKAMKKGIIFILICLLLYYVVAIRGCGHNVSGTLEPGTTISTDIVDFTFEGAHFAVALSNIEDENYLLPVENYDNDNPFVVPVGSTLVSLTFRIKNNDRVPLSLGIGRDYSFNFDLLYKNKKYDILGGSVAGNTLFNSSNISLYPSYITTEDGKGTCYADPSYVCTLQPGETVTIRTAGRVKTEVDSLSDPFKLRITVYSSGTKYKNYTYTNK